VADLEQLLRRLVGRQVHPFPLCGCIWLLGNVLWSLRHTLLHSGRNGSDRERPARLLGPTVRAACRPGGRGEEARGQEAASTAGGEGGEGGRKGRRKGGTSCDSSRESAETDRLMKL
jgi:hypothetical protein